MQWSVVRCRQSRFFYRLSIRGVRMAHSGNVFCRSPKLHGGNTFGNQVRTAGSYHVDTKDFIGLFVRNYFHKAIYIHTGPGPSQSTHGKLSHFVVHTGLFELLFRFAHCCHFWPGIYHTRYEVVVNMRFLSGNQLGPPWYPPLQPCAPT